MAIQEESILFLLGAGSSVDAGIPHAIQMTQDIERKVNGVGKFSSYKDLYNFLKSSIIYQRGLSGNFNLYITIEDLLSILQELNKKDKNQLYPFIGSWNTHLLKVSGDGFENISEFETLIRDQLLAWVQIDHYDQASYFSKLGDLANEVGRSIKVFSLNYDICVEKALERNGTIVELGFDTESHKWEAGRFERTDFETIQVYLYKLHGSIDWMLEKEESGNLIKCDGVSKEPNLIFGETSKMNSIDPYLFYIHEFRRHSLDKYLRIIFIIGYSFSDDYINKLITQAVRNNQYLRLVVVSPNADNSKSDIASKLNIADNFIIPCPVTAKVFFEEKLSMQFCEENMAVDPDVPF